MAGNIFQILDWWKIKVWHPANIPQEMSGRWKWILDTHL